MTQYEIWWADLPKPVGRRPVLLLSRAPAYEYLNKFICASISRRIRRIPQEVLLGRPEGLGGACAANFDNLQLIHRDALSARIGMLSPRRVTDAKRALGHALGWPELLQP